MINYSKDLLKIISEQIPISEPGDVIYSKGEFDYWHYGCDGINDQGWGCGYRTLQTISSWIINNQELNKVVPNILDIQNTLVSINDKSSTFSGSKQWIGSFEVCLVLDTLYNISSKMVHIPNYENFTDYKNSFINHFENNSSPIMMGGDKDCSSKGIVGIHNTENKMYLLILDPHFIGKAKTIKQLIDDGYIYWQNVNDLNKQSFYNICFPQVKYNKR